MIELRQVTMHYPLQKGLFAARSQKTVLQDFSLSIQPGERVALLGVNGAGKTTLIKLMLGIIQPSAGEIEFSGHPSHRYPDALKRRFNALFAQKSQLWWNIPVRDSLEILGLTYGLAMDAITETLAELTDIFCITDLLDRPPRFLSFGQRLRCELVATLLTKPDVLFLDEPFIGLDYETRQTLTRYLHQYLETHGTTLVIASHDLACIESLVKRIVIIDGHTLIMDGGIQELSGAGNQRTAIELRFPGEPDSSILLRLNSLYPIFPEASWDYRIEQQNFSIILRLPSNEPSHLYFAHEFARETLGCSTVSFRDHRTLEEILAHLREQPADRFERIRTAMTASIPGETEENCLLRLLRVRGELTAAGSLFSPGTRPGDPASQGEEIAQLDGWTRELSALYHAESRLKIRTFLLGFLASCRDCSWPQPRLSVLQTLLAALGDPDARLQATAVETTGAFLLSGRETPPPDDESRQILDTLQHQLVHCLENPDKRVRANAYLACLRIRRGSGYTALLQQLIRIPELFPSFPWLFEILTLHPPFLSGEQTVEEPPAGWNGVLQELLVTCIRHGITLSPNTFNRCLGLLYNQRTDQGGIQ